MFFTILASQLQHNRDYALSPLLVHCLPASVWLDSITKEYEMPSEDKLNHSKEKLPSTAHGSDLRSGQNLRGSKKVSIWGMPPIQASEVKEKGNRGNAFAAEQAAIPALIFPHSFAHCTTPRSQAKRMESSFPSFMHY